jgi:SAM-dependent methyltransferase
VLAARARTAVQPQVDVRVGAIPEDLPDAQFDLVIASEVLYYLDGDALDAVLGHVCAHLTPCGRIVAVHWRTPGPERPLSADAVHARLHREPALRPLGTIRHRSYLLDVLEAR